MKYLNPILFFIFSTIAPTQRGKTDGRPGQDANGHLWGQDSSKAQLVEI